MMIHYWDSSKEILVETCNRKGQGLDITITPDDIEIDVEGEYYGPVDYYHEISTYDMCSLMALHREVYPECYELQTLAERRDGKDGSK